MMHRYEVGQPYSSTRRTWPEVMQFNYRSGAHELVLFLNDPTAREVAAVQRGTAEFALYTNDLLIVLLYRFSGLSGSLGWGDAPYSWHQVPADQQQSLPSLDLTPDQRATLQITLVNARTGIIMALRVVSLSHEFTIALHRAIIAQSAASFPEATYDALVNLFQARYPNPDQAVKRAIARCRGGE